MEDQEHQSGSRRSERSEAVRSRWTPKPEQILILESIFNSGMVNPPKDDTVRIRKLLEKFGSVGDANVFYWFQNRRSRSRRRQRQIQAAGEHINYENAAAAGGYHVANPAAVSSCPISTASSSLVGSSFGNEAANSDGFFSFSGQVQDSFFVAPDSSNSHYQSGVITVFINGVATEVGRGAVDMKAMFGGDYVLLHSSGVAVEVNEHGFLVQSLQHGESYFLALRFPNSLNFKLVVDSSSSSFFSGSKTFLSFRARSFNLIQLSK